MTESITTQLVSLIEGIVPLYFTEAETEEYPYAVYNAPIIPVRSKDGILKYTTQASIAVYAKDYDAASGKADLIVDALETGMRSDQYTATLRNLTSTRVEGVWEILLEYTINQYQ